MRKTIQLSAIILSLFATFIIWLSNSDVGRNLYNEYLKPNLSKGINKLFPGPNKYRSAKANQRYVGKLRYFYLQKRGKIKMSNSRQ